MNLYKLRKILSLKKKYKRKLMLYSRKTISISMMRMEKIKISKKVKLRDLSLIACLLTNATLKKATLSPYITKKVREKLSQIRCQISSKDARKKCKNKDKFLLMHQSKMFQPKLLIVWKVYKNLNINSKVQSKRNLGLCRKFLWKE